VLDHPLIAVVCDDVGALLIFIDCEILPVIKAAALIGDERGRVAASKDRAVNTV